MLSVEKALSGEGDVSWESNSTICESQLKPVPRAMDVGIETGWHRSEQRDDGQVRELSGLWILQVSLSPNIGFKSKSMHRLRIRHLECSWVEVLQVEVWANKDGAHLRFEVKDSLIRALLVEKNVSAERPIRIEANNPSSCPVCIWYCCEVLWGGAECGEDQDWAERKRANSLISIWQASAHSV